MLVKSWAGLAADSDIFDILVMAEVVDKNNSWPEFEDTLTEVVRGSATGVAIFRVDSKAIEGDRDKELIGKILEDLGKETKIDNNLVNKFKKVFTDQSGAIGADVSQAWSKPQEVQVKYTKVEFNVTVSSHKDHFSMQYMSFVKGAAVENGVGADVRGEQVVVRVDLWEDRDRRFHAGGATITECASELKDGSGGEIVKLLKAHHALLVSMDCRWPIDVGIFTALAGDAGQRRYHSKIWSLLPTEAKSVVVKACLSQLRALAESELVTYCGKALVNQLDTIIGWVSTAAQTRMIKLGLADGTLLRTAALRLAFFVREPMAGGKGAAAGKGAIRTIIGKLKADSEKGAAITLKMCENVQVDRYLLSEDDSKLVEKWTDNHLARPLPEFGSSSSSSAHRAKAARKAVATKK